MLRVQAVRHVLRHISQHIAQRVTSHDIDGIESRDGHNGVPAARTVTCQYQDQ
ncbi:protein of unknown function [Pararobbsia alpina]